MVWKKEEMIEKMFRRNKINGLFHRLYIICFFLMSFISCIERIDKKEFRVYEINNLLDDKTSYLIFRVYHDYPYEYIYDWHFDTISGCRSGKLKFRHTEDTLFLCNYKGDNVGIPYMIKDSNVVHRTPFLYFPMVDCESIYLGDTLMNINGKEMVISKFEKKPEAIDVDVRIEYYDSSCIYMGSESMFELIHLIDTVPNFLKKTIDSLSCERMEIF